MTPPEIDRIIAKAAEQAGTVDRTALDRISQALTGSLQPVRPMAAPWMQIAGLIAAVAAIAISGGAGLGFFGFLKLSVPQNAAILLTLTGIVCLAAAASAGAMIPGTRRIVDPTALPGVAAVAILGVFAVTYHDYSLGRFVPDGLICLKAGLLFAVPAALLAAVILRRGYAVNRGAAGLAAGTLAGLAGLTMLELHCPNLRAPHVMVWHVAPVPLGALAGWLIYSFAWKRKDAELMQ